MTLPTYSEAWAAARPEPAFSNNGTEGMAWCCTWCARCVHDKGARTGADPAGCPLIGVSLMGRTPAEWLDQTRDGTVALGNSYQCLYFRDENDPGPDEPTPIPDPPGQLTLLPREPYTRPARMYADTKPAPAPALT